jgi:hypothetical protein
MMSPGELLFFGIIQARRFRPVLACADPRGLNDEQSASARAQALRRDKCGERWKGRGGQAWSCVDSMMQYLGYCSYWRKRFKAFFGSYVGKARFQTTIGRLAIETLRGTTLTVQPFANLSPDYHGFSGFTAAMAAVNSAPKNGVDHP